MNPIKRFWAWLGRGRPNLLAAADAAPVVKERKRINPTAAARFGKPEGSEAAVAAPREVQRYEPPKGVIAGDAAAVKMAMDFDGTDYGYLNTIVGWGDAAFRGYQYLALLAQRPEYRKISETLAKEATRKWIKLTAQGDNSGTSERLVKLEKAMKAYGVRDLFRRMAEMDGFYGRGQLFIDVKTPGGANAQDMPGELETVLLRDKAKIKKGALIGFRAVEPVWTYPGQYNSTNPLAADFYRPSKWYVMGKTVHSTRLLSFISREVPDMLKASYNFGGLSMSQLAEPYVNNWLRTRDSVSDLVHSFSLTQLATDLSSTLTEGDDGGDLYARLDLFNRMRDNRGTFVVNKDSEELSQFNTPLSGLDKLQAQAQEQMSAVSNIPLVKLLGVTPSGLNASSDGEVRVFYDFVHSYQEDLFRDPLIYVLNIIQLSEFGDIDEGIGFDFVPLWQPDAKEAADIRKVDADTDAVLLECSAITPEEIRDRLIADPDSPYTSLEPNAAVSDEPGGDQPEPPVIAAPGETAKPPAPVAA